MGASVRDRVGMMTASFLLSAVPYWSNFSLWDAYSSPRLGCLVWSSTWVLGKPESKCFRSRQMWVMELQGYRQSLEADSPWWEKISRSVMVTRALLS